MSLIREWRWGLELSEKIVDFLDVSVIEIGGGWLKGVEDGETHDRRAIETASGVVDQNTSPGSNKDHILKLF